MRHVKNWDRRIISFHYSKLEQVIFGGLYLDKSLKFGYENLIKIFVEDFLKLFYEDPHSELTLY